MDTSNNPRLVELNIRIHNVIRGEDSAPAGEKLKFQTELEVLYEQRQKLISELIEGLINENRTKRKNKES